MSIYAPTLTTLWRHILAEGLDPKAIFLTEGIDHEVLGDDSIRLSYDVVDRLRSEAAIQSGNPVYGLQTAKFWHPSSMGGLGYAWLLSSSLLDALQTCARYIRMLNEGLEMKVEMNKSEVLVSLTYNRESVNPTVREDSNAALLMSMCRANYGPDFHPMAVQLKHSKSGASAPYFSFFQCPVSFDAEETRLHFDRKQAELACLNANEQLRQMSLNVVHQYLTRFDGDDFKTSVRTEILQQLPNGKITDGSVASALHMTSRTLQRKLQVESTTFKALLTGVRTELAQQYIADSSLSLTEISFLLGFAETSSFSRAYKRWTGESPSAVND